jgi:hypothetical protein
VWGFGVLKEMHKQESKVFRSSNKWLVGALALSCFGSVNCSRNNGQGSAEVKLTSDVVYDESTQELLVALSRDLKGNETLHTRIRPLSAGESLDCAVMSSDIPTLTDQREATLFIGPKVEPTMFEPQTTPDSLLNNSMEDYQRRQDNTYFIDVCVMDGGKVAHQARYDLRQALDRDGNGLSGKFDQFDDGERIASNQAYAAACISAMGDIPFWTRLDADKGNGKLVHDVEEGSALAKAMLKFANESSNEELDAVLDERAVVFIVDARPIASLEVLDAIDYVGPAAFRQIASHVQESGLVVESESFDWNTVDCTEIGTPIPSTVDGVPHETKVDKCDNPQQIYSHCEPDATTGANGPRVASARNAQGTHWVLLCRKSHSAQGRYEDMAMIGHNPFTGQTCFFQNQLPPGESPRPANDGTKIPHPADNVSSEASPQVWNDLWGGIEGGIGRSGGIQCQGCHSTDPFIHTPWIDGAKDAKGDPIVPKMGHNPDFVEGYGGPYTLIDAQDQGWSQPLHLVSEEASACTKCHRIGRDQWISDRSLNSRDNAEGGCVFCGQAPWINRFDHNDANWDRLLTETGNSFDHYYWMPPDAGDVLNEDLWPESDYAKSLAFIRMCGAEPSNPACKWEPLPSEPGDPTTLPEVELTGQALAERALDILGAPYQKDGAADDGDRRCAECHATSKRGFRDWLELTERANQKGIDLRQDVEGMSQEEALELVRFMRRDNTDDSVFAAYNTGILVAGAQFPYFRALFQKAYGNDWGIPYGQFLARVSMPKGSHPPLSAEEFAIVQKWFVEEKLSNIDDLLVETPPPASCDEVRQQYGLTQHSPWLDSHLDDMEFDGWGARNDEKGINMFGCDSGKGVGCFSDKEDITEFNTNQVAGARLIEVLAVDFSTSFWTRSSADGRFVGNGGRGSSEGNFGATITDLVTGQNIGVRGSYDPGFFPNNDGFIMQGRGAGLCGQSVLTNTEAIEGGIDFTEAGCSNAEGINLYQHVAVDTDGGDYFVINSEFTSDSGRANEDPKAPFYEGSTMKFSPMVFDGNNWSQKPAVVVDSPYEGDSVLSPSGKMVISRFAGPDGKALGYMIRRVQVTPSGESYDVNIRQAVQFLCLPGAKANISFDERFSVTHVYENETANIYLTDILTGETVKVTEMPAGTKALFPHFRSDGWFYFLAKGGDGDRVLASDAALRMLER